MKLSYLSTGSAPHPSSSIQTSIVAQMKFVRTSAAARPAAATPSCWEWHRRRPVHDRQGPACPRRGERRGGHPGWSVLRRAGEQDQVVPVAESRNLEDGTSRCRLQRRPLEGGEDGTGSTVLPARRRTTRSYCCGRPQPAGWELTLPFAAPAAAGPSRTAQDRACCRTPPKNEQGRICCGRRDRQEST